MDHRNFSGCSHRVREMDPVEIYWQEQWKKDSVFEAKPDNRKKYLLTVPWPYTSGPLHAGHARTYSIADFIARYKRLTGFNVMYPMGFHESGTPILAISQRIRRGDQTAIDLYRKYIGEYEPSQNISSIIDTFKDQEKLAGYFAEKIRKDFDSLGFSIDWSREFKSVEPVYKDVVSWQFRKLHDLGYITQGRYPILYNSDEESAVGEDDIEDGDTDKVSIEEFTSIIFEGEEFSLAASTLRPETLPGVVNLWISNEEKYVLCTLNSRKIVVSISAKEKLSRQENNISELEPISVEKIISNSFRNPFNGEILRVYSADFVDPNNATGVVASVPSNSIIDFLECKKLGINYEQRKFIKVGDNYSSAESFLKIHKVDLSDPEAIARANSELYKIEFYEGVMDYPEFKGKKVSKAREEIGNTLKTKNSAFIIYETSRKARTRSGSPVTVAVFSNQWFLDYSNSNWKIKAHKTVQNMNFYPAHYKNGMNEVIDWLKERPCARMRGLGTQLPFDDKWIIESLSDSTIYPAVYTCIDSLRRIYEEKGGVDDQTLDFIFTDFGKSSDEMAIKAREWFRYWYGVDLRITAFPHFTNHLAFYIMNHSALLPEFAQPGGIMIAGTMISNGKKISKSKGNSISLLQIASNFGADLFRLYVAVTSDPTSVVDWNEEDVSVVGSRFSELKNLITEVVHSGIQNQSGISDWFCQSFYLHLKKYRESMEAMNIRLGFIEIFYGVLNDISKLKFRGINPTASIRVIIKPWLKALSPVICHFTEEMWHKLGNKTYISSEMFTEDEMKEPQMGPIEDEIYLENIVSDIREVIKVTKKNPEEIRIIVCSSEKASLVGKILNGKEIEQSMKWVIPLVMKNRKFIKNDINERKILSDSTSYLSQIFSCRFVITDDEDEGDKRRIPLPGKPLIKLL